MQRKSDSFCPTYGKQAVQCSENIRNSLGLNYKSAALPAMPALPDMKAVLAS
jgi:hypothetical protein